MMVDDLSSKQWLDLENTMLAAVTESIQAKTFELVHLVPDAEGIEKITVAAIEQNFQVALSFCRATLFGQKLPRTKVLQDMLQRLDVLAGEQLTEGLNKGKKLTYYMYEIEKLKQLIYSVKRVCVRKPNSKSTKVNTLRAMYREMCAEATLESQSSEAPEEKNVVVGHVDTDQRSNEPIHAIADATPSEPEIIISDSSGSENEDANEEADLVAVTNDEPDLVELIESESETQFWMDLGTPVPGVLAPAAPVPGVLAAAAAAPMLDHALQRKERTAKKAPKSTGKNKKKKAKNICKITKKAKAPAKTTAPAARFRLMGKQPEPASAPPCKKARKANAPAKTSPANTPPGNQIYTGPLRIVRSIQRELEIFQVRDRTNALIQVTTNSAPGRCLAIQWIGILKEVFEAGATKQEAAIVKDWLQRDLSDRWGNVPLNVITGGELLGLLNTSD